MKFIDALNMLNAVDPSAHDFDFKIIVGDSTVLVAPRVDVDKGEVIFDAQGGVASVPRSPSVIIGPV